MATSTPFDGARSIKEEISGLVEVAKALGHRVRHAERIHAESEVELNALRKLDGFAKAELVRKREVLRRLEEEPQ